MVTLKYFLDAKQTNVSNLILDYYHKIGMTDRECLLYLQLVRYEQANSYFPDLGLISEKMGLPVDDLYTLVQGLMNKGILAIDTLRNERGQTEDRYDLTLIYQRIAAIQEQEVVIKEEENEQTKVTSMFQQFEQEFGRVLSPIELETIQTWLSEDKYSVELIELALREAVLNQAYSLKYMDRILLAWERKNLRTKQDVQQDQKKRVLDSGKKEAQEEILPHIPLYNWLNPSESGK